MRGSANDVTDVGGRVAGHSLSTLGRGGEMLLGLPVGVAGLQRTVVITDGESCTAIVGLSSRVVARQVITPIPKTSRPAKRGLKDCQVGDRRVSDNGGNDGMTASGRPVQRPEGSTAVPNAASTRVVEVGHVASDGVAKGSR